MGNLFNKHRKKLITFILLLLLLLLSIFALNKCQNTNNSLKEDSSAVSYNSKIDKPENFDSSQLVFPGYDKITVKKGSKYAYVALVNPDFNKANFKFTVELDKPHQKLLETDLVVPGKAVKEVPLPENLSVGEYSLTIKTDAFDLTNNSQLNGAEGKATLVVIEDK